MSGEFCKKFIHVNSIVDRDTFLQMIVVGHVTLIVKVLIVLKN